MEVDQVADFDERFEFDAPRYYDFEAMDGGGTPCDKWFDSAPDGPGVKPEKGAVGEREPFKQIQQEQQPAAAAAQAPAASPGEKKKSNIVTNWGQAAERKISLAAGHGSKPNAAAAAPNTANTSAAAVGRSAPAAAGAAAGAPAKAAGAAAEEAPAGIPAPAAAAAAATAAAAAPACKSMGVGTRKSLGVGARRICSTKDGSRTEPPVTRSMSRLGVHICSPVPEGKARSGGGSPPMTRARKCVTAHKPKATTSRTQPLSVQKLHAVLQPRVTKPMRSTKPLTLPDDIELETDKRLANRAAAGAGGPEQIAKSPFKSLAEKVREFQAKTPVRFKTKPAKPAPSKQHPPITRAESPQLMTSRRARAPTCKSQAELEQEELERQRKEQFHAKPLDSRVLTSSGQLGVPKVQKPAPTEPRPFALRSDSRARVRKSHEQPSMEQAAAAAGGFRAHPLNRSILDGPTFKPHKERHETTVPKSPLLRTKLRSHTANPEDQKDNRQQQRSLSQAKERPGSAGRPVSAGRPGSAGRQSGGLTHPQPFRLQTEARGAHYQDELAARLAAEEARAKRLRRVTARPLPVTIDLPAVPPKPETKPLTLPDPFELKSLSRHEEFEEKRRRQLQEEEEAARRAAEFKARPVHTAGPFVVHESDAPLTVPVDPDLATEHRAVDRHEFDEHVTEKMREQEDERRRQAELKRRQEEEATRQYRKKLRFSARPMPSFEHPYMAQPSDKPLTNPKTPNFASKKLKKTG
uniref:TPX2 C-terminal domain-containing protein n=1 Tax=Tetradesmus obliquus TaxID=3088 RepID=A0A383VSF2_TETOB|eukprot:jgi/Sobl393_1/15959/SZX78786.1